MLDERGNLNSMASARRDDEFEIAAPATGTLCPPSLTCFYSNSLCTVRWWNMLL